MSSCGLRLAACPVQVPGFGTKRYAVAVPCPAPIGRDVDIVSQSSPPSPSRRMQLQVSRSRRFGLSLFLCYPVRFLPWQCRRALHVAFRVYWLHTLVAQDSAEQDAHTDSAVGAPAMLCTAGSRCRGLLQGQSVTPHVLRTSFGLGPVTDCIVL